MRVFVIALLLGGVGALESKGPRPLKLNKALKTRGGAVLPVEPVATFAATISSINAAQVALAPSKACELYGVPHSALTEWIIEFSGFNLICSAVSMWLTLKGVEAQKVVAWGITPFFAIIAKNILNATPQKFGAPVAGQYLLGAVCLATAYPCFTGADWAEGAIKGFVGWNVLNGLGFFLAPEPSLKAWGLTDCTESEYFMMSSFGSFVLSSAVLTACIGIFGLDAPKSIAYSFLPLLANLVKTNFITGETAKFNLAVPPQYVWLAIITVILVSCGI